MTHYSVRRFIWKSSVNYFRTTVWSGLSLQKNIQEGIKQVVSVVISFVCSDSRSGSTPHRPLVTCPQGRGGFALGRYSFLGSGTKFPTLQLLFPFVRVCVCVSPQSSSEDSSTGGPWSQDGLTRSCPRVKPSPTSLGLSFSTSKEHQSLHNFTL